MLDKVLSFVAPHHCCSCDKIGSLLCDNCKYNIIEEQNPVCILCGRPTSNFWLCNEHKTPYERVYIVGMRKGALQRLVGLFKIERAYEAHKSLGDLILAILPELPKDTVIVPVPTVASHVRERGYDHMLLIAKYISKKRGLKLELVLSRKTNTKQRQSSAKKRNEQAKNAFEVSPTLDPNKIYLLVDDVITTGATIKYASLALKEAGARHIFVAAVSRQPLD